MFGLNTDEAVRDNGAQSLPIPTPSATNVYQTKSDFVASREYKAALALNNVGVLLTRRGLYNEAVCTFKKSFDFVKNIHLNPNNDRVYSNCCSEGCVTNTSQDEQNVESHLSLAYQKLLRGQNKCTTNDGVPGEGSETVFEVSVLSDDDSESIHDAAHSYPTINNGYVIHIDTACDYFTSNFLMEVATIVMNYATAYRCLASLELKPDSTRAKRYVSCAYKLFRLAYGILSNDEIEIESKNDCVILDRIDLLRLLAVKGLMPLAYHLNLLDEAKIYYSLLGDLHVNQIPRNQGASHTYGIKSNAPAA